MFVFVYMDLVLVKRRCLFIAWLVFVEVNRDWMDRWYILLYIKGLFVFS